MVYDCIYGQPSPEEYVNRLIQTDSQILSLHAYYQERRQVGCSFRSWVILAGWLTKGRRTWSGIRVNTTGVTHLDGPGVVGQEQVTQPVLYKLELEAMGDVGVLG